MKIEQEWIDGLAAYLIDGPRSGPANKMAEDILKLVVPDVRAHVLAEIANKANEEALNWPEEGRTALLEFTGDLVALIDREAEGRWIEAMSAREDKFGGL